MVKKVFPLLLSYVFVTTQCWALDGGPVYGGSNGRINPVGVYSGVLTGLTESDAAITGPTIPGDTVGSGTTTPVTTNSNALGLFDLAVPATGTASGGFLLFADGEIFSGTIEASADPQSDVLQGIVEGTFSFALSELTTTTTTSTTVTAEAFGSITAKIAAPKNSTVTARLTGSATLDINFGEVNTTTLQPVVDRILTFSVNGFQQSTNSASTVTSLTSTSTGTATSGGASGTGD